MNTKRPKFVAAITFVEVIIAAAIVTIGIAGSSLLFINGRSWICQQKAYRVATQLAAQTLEEAKARSYDNIYEEPNDIDLEDVSYSRSIYVADMNSYKEVRVTVGWTRMGRYHNVNLVTIIAPE